MACSQNGMSSLPSSSSSLHLYANAVNGQMIYGLLPTATRQQVRRIIANGTVGFNCSRATLA